MTLPSYWETYKKLHKEGRYQELKELSVNHMIHYGSLTSLSGEFNTTYARIQPKPYKDD